MTMPSGAERVNDVIGSDRSFGASNPIDSELLLARKVGVATTWAAAGAPSPTASVTPPRAEMAGGARSRPLIRALADLENLLIPIEARDRRLLHVAEPAVDLECRVRDAVRELSGEELRHRRLARERTPLVLEPGSFVHERAPGLDLGRHVGELEPDRRYERARLAQLLAVVCVREREIVCPLRQPDSQRGDRDAPAVEDLQELVEALAARSEQIVLGDRAVLERELACVGCTPAELLHRCRDRVAWRSVLDDDVRDLVDGGPRREGHTPGDVG